MRALLGIDTAAKMAGISTRHFRRIIAEERIRVVQIGRKHFILGSDFAHWQMMISSRLGETFREHTMAQKVRAAVEVESPDKISEFC